MTEPLHQFKAEFFKALAHPTRIRILERLRLGDAAVGDLQRALELDQSVVSQQLGVLRREHIVEAHKQGASVRYEVRDETLFVLLDAARRMFNNRLATTQSLLRQLRAEDRAARPGRGARRRIAPR